MNEIPRLGLGTWENTDPDQCAESVATALDVGYRHIDTAQAYDNEADVGNGIRQAGVDREEIFLATKVWIDKLARDDVFSSTERSLDRLGVDYLDLLYIHWPGGKYKPRETLGAFRELQDDDVIQHVGVSNFTPELLDEARNTTDVEIFANQVEMHPLLQQDELVEYVQRHDMNLVAYSPLARGNVFGIPELVEVAEKHDVSEAQVSIAWLLQKENVAVIPKATSEAHIRDNYEALSLELDTEDVAMIDAIEEEERIIDPSFAPDW